MTDIDKDALLEKVARAIYNALADDVNLAVRFDPERVAARAVLDAIWPDVEAALRVERQAREEQHYADERRFREFADRHGWCADGGMTTEECAATVCDCGYEGQTWNLMRARAEEAEAERGRWRTLAKHHEAKLAYAEERAERAEAVADRLGDRVADLNDALRDVQRAREKAEADWDAAYSLMRERADRAEKAERALSDLRGRVKALADEWSALGYSGVVYESPAELADILRSLLDDASGD